MGSFVLGCCIFTFYWSKTNVEWRELVSACDTGHLPSCVDWIGDTWFKNQTDRGHMLLCSQPVLKNRIKGFERVNKLIGRKVGQNTLWPYVAYITNMFTCVLVICIYSFLAVCNGPGVCNEGHCSFCYTFLMLKAWWRSDEVKCFFATGCRRPCSSSLVFQVRLVCVC